MKNNEIKKNDDLMAGRIVQIAAIIFALLLAVFIVFINRKFYHDDAYITLRYARNYIAGLGIVWNPGEYVQGYTNFLHLIFISFLGKLGINLVWASRVVSGIAYAGLVAVVALFGITFENERRASLWHLPAIIVATSASILVWTLGGLEGILFSFLSIGGSLLFLVAMNSLKSCWLYAASGITLGLSFLARPDGIVFISVSCVYLFWLILKHKTSVFDLMAFVAGVVLVTSPYIIWQATYYGDIVPNTFYAKAGVPLWLKLKTGISYLLNYLIHPPFLPFFVFISLVYAFLKRLWSLKLTYLMLLVTAYLAFIIFIAGGDHMQSFRMMLPIIPLMGAVLALVLSVAIGLKHRRIINNITIAVLILTSSQILDRKLNPQREDPASFVGTIVGKYISEAWPAGSLIALNTAGSTPYYAESNRYIDMLGLNDPTIAKRKIKKIVTPWQKVPGHLKGDGGYVLSRHPDYIIMGPAEGTISSKPWFLSDFELNYDQRFLLDYAPFRVFLDKNGRQIAKGGILFTYYKKVGGAQGKRFRPTTDSSRQRDASAAEPKPL